jgi:hypothetical protein
VTAARVAHWNNVDVLVVLASSTPDFLLRTAAAKVLADDERRAMKEVGG